VAGAILALGGAARQAVTPLAKLKEEEPHAVP
jgi:hypothetical protein